MTGKEALTDLKGVSVCGYDSNEKEYYYSGLLNEVYDEEVTAIETDLDLVQKFKDILSNCTATYCFDGDRKVGKAVIVNPFDVEFFKDLVSQLGYELHEKR